MKTVNMCKWVAPMVKLADGREVPSDCEEWRAECEARYILNLPNKPARMAQLDKVEKHRGPAGRKSLEADVLRLWNLQRAQRGAA